MLKLLYSVGIIITGLCIGYGLQLLILKNPKFQKINKQILMRWLIRIAMLGISPIALVGALWNVELANPKLFVLPFIGATAFILGGVLAFLFAKMQKMSPKQMGSYIISGTFTNIGVIGGLIAFIFLGEIGFALMPIYKIFEEIIYFGFGFPLAKSFSETHHDDIDKQNSIRRIFKDIFIRVAIISMLIGLTLNLSGIERPDFYSDLNSILIPISSLLLLTSIGLNLRFFHMFQYIRQGLVMAMIKSMIVPAVITFLAYLLGMGQIQDGLGLKVVFILSSMPVGFISLVPPTIYDLDVDLANACFVGTFVAMLVVIPWIGFVVGLL